MSLNSEDHSEYGSDCDIPRIKDHSGHFSNTPQPQRDESGDNF